MTQLYMIIQEINQFNHITEKSIYFEKGPAIILKLAAPPLVILHAKQ